MTNQSEGDHGSEPLRAPGSGFQALGRRSVAFQDSQALDKIRQHASQGNLGTPREEEEKERDLAGDLASDTADLPPYDGQSLDEPPADMEKSDAQRQLHEYRERLARDMERRDKTSRGGQAPASEMIRVSPIEEESSSTSPPPVSEPTTASTESGHTVRGGMTPGFTARTPSYPFPRMVAALAQSPQNQSFPSISPTMEGLKAQDSILSNPSTPASAVTFLPQGFAQSGEPHDFPSPNLYDLSLMLSAEPGLDAWWNTVVQIMTEVYRAERVTLAVPADSTDIENVPWGQKATFNARLEDDLSLGYMARGSSLNPSSSTDDASEAQSQVEELLKPRTPLRPPLLNRHSFTSYEDRKEKSIPERSQSSMSLRRPGPPPRSQSSFQASSQNQDPNSLALPGTGLNRKALEEHDALEEELQNVPSWEAPLENPGGGQGKVLNVLQALDFEADPLIDHNGVSRVLERGRVIALTRNYPYLDPAVRQSQSPESKSAGHTTASDSTKNIRKQRADSSSKLSSLLGSAAAASTRSAKGPVGDAKSIASRMDDVEPRPRTPKYEEFEQAPPSPWSQSPAPSPIVRADPSENPFFTDAMVDEESFNPSTSPQNYSDMIPLEAIGVEENSWTVLHIPLTHVLLSKPSPAFRLDAKSLERKSLARGKSESKLDGSLLPTPSPAAQKEKHSPIAILSILSPIIPYPSNLRYSLEHLAPHLATSFSLCRHYTNLEIELNGLQKRRPHAAGFGAVGLDGRPLMDSGALASLSFLPAEDPVSRASMGGSITSPSDYSGAARSTVDSPGGTPIWDPSGLGFVQDKRTSASASASASSPGPTGGDSYFTTKPRTTAGSAGQRARRNSRESPTTEKRTSLRLSSGKGQQPDTGLASPASPDSQSAGDATILGGGREDLAAAAAQQRRPRSRDSKELGTKGENTAPGATSSLPASAAGGQHRHTQLHSYGADFASTFQSLPPSSNIGKGVPQTQPPSRTGSVSQMEMTPPSDRLKSLILDSLPAHVFVALPQTGEIVWVNSRFLSYRGQTSGGLAADPWGSIHPSDRDEYLRAWSHCVRTGEQFSRTVRIKRFDGAFRWFYARAVASKDKRGVILQFLGSYMDIHDQHIAELRAARQEEIETSEAKHRLLANLIPQIIFTATEEDGITFSNEQWLSYTGQSYDDVLGLGFMDYVHPDDLAKCRLPVVAEAPSTPLGKETKTVVPEASPSAPKFPSALSGKLGAVPAPLSRNNSSSNGSVYDLPTVNLTELAKKGVIKVSRDSNGRLSYTTEIRLRSKSGEYRWHLVRCVEIDNIDFGNGASSYFGSATDINDLKLLETKLKEAMESKGRFLSNMSHEIRTPLIGISGMVSFLQDTVLNEEQRDYTNTIQTSANSLLMIINDILDLSKVDAAMMKLNFEWFRIQSLIEDVNELVSTMAIAKRLELTYVVDRDVPTWIKGDKVRIRQILLNVIGNAIKFTSEGEVFSHCRVIVPEGSNLQEGEIMLEFSVADTGRGFTQEEAELIFKPFSQIDGSSTRQHGGSGLGLVISRQLAELHGGSMDGVAVPGEGSTFTFSARFGLPSASDRPNAPSTPEESSAPKSIQEMLTNLPRLPLGRAPTPQQPATGSPSAADREFVSPAMASSGSSEPSVQSGRTQITDRSSMSSIQAGLVRFGEAARASGQDLSQMRLEIPSGKSSPDTTPTPNPEGFGGDANSFRPPIYSILVICPQKHSRWATTQHIEMTLPKDIPHQITALASVEEAEKLIGGEDPVIFTHIVVNLPSSDEIIGIIRQVVQSGMGRRAQILVLSDSVLKQTVLKQVAGTRDEELLSEGQVAYIPKPIKTSRFAVIFDPAKEREQSLDHNRSSAQRLVENQKQSYIEVEKRMGNKGYKVLLVEDNPVNQKVLQKYLKKVGVEVELAADGAECTDKIFSQGHGCYSLILVCLSLPLSLPTTPFRSETSVVGPPGYGTCRLTINSAICICRARMGIRPAAKFEIGRPGSTTAKCPLSRSRRTSCPTSTKSVSRLASVIMSPNRSTSSS